ncbi:MAG: S8 family serine peptidase [Candidatus Zixiibacteriota bacterium]|nr:MAG: S8 family serine peptidase [candidate division Zixibacteria bacterium]
MSKIQLVSAAIILTLLLIGNVVSADSGNRHPLKWSPPQKNEYSPSDDYSHMEAIVFKLNEGTQAPTLENSRFGSTDAVWSRLNDALFSIDGVTGIGPCFSLDPDVLINMREVGQRRSGSRLPSLTLFYRVALRADMSSPDKARLVDRLNRHELVEIAYLSSKPVLASVSETEATPAWESQQYYLQPAPTGINAYYGWDFPGGKGENIKVIDIEGNWIQTHEDLHGGTDDFHIAGARIDDPTWWNHGTAVLGEIAADSNDFGMTGIAFNVDLGTVSVGSMSIENAIATASANAAVGDIILIELQIYGPNGGNYVAVEYEEASFAAILTASALGQIVVEAAANGNEDYDNIYIYDSLFYPEYRFSGAIMVGASTADHVPASFTNYGRRVDVHAFGAWDVYTLGYGDLWGSGPDDFYTSTFSGTSSASPIIVGACAILQGIQKATYGTTFDHADLRDLLTAYSTPQASHYKEIGPMPDLGGSCEQVYGVSFTADPTSGWVPLDVNFTGSSGLAVDIWTWDFGDGDFAYVQSPFHTYDEPGIFDVSLEVNAGGEIRQLTREEYIIALADTVKAPQCQGAPGEQVEVVITGNNTLPVNYIKLPVLYPGDLPMTYDSISTLGCRTEDFDVQDCLHVDPWNRRLTVRLIASTTTNAYDLPPGQGDIVKIYFTINSWATEGQSAGLLIEPYLDYVPEYQTRYFDYEVATVAGSIGLTTSCCLARGDVDHSGQIDLLDLTYLVDYFWASGPAPPCEEEAEINGEEPVNTLDLIYMVDYFWVEGPPPPACP